MSASEQNSFRKMISLAILLGVSLIVMVEVLDILPDSGSFVSAAGQVDQLIATTFELAPIVIVVLIAAVVLRKIRDF